MIVVTPKFFIFIAVREQVLWYAFDTQTYEHTLRDTMLDELPHSSNYLVEINGPVSSIEMSGAHVLVPEPIHVGIFDKHCKRQVIIVSA